MLRLVMNIIWPAFLAAIVAEGCFFSLFEPSEFISIEQHGLSPIACYTIGFFFFWMVGTIAATLTCYLGRAPENRSKQP